MVGVATDRSADLAVAKVRVFVTPPPFLRESSPLSAVLLLLVFFLFVRVCFVACMVPTGVLEFFFVLFWSRVTQSLLWVIAIILSNLLILVDRRSARRSFLLDVTLLDYRSDPVLVMMRRSWCWCPRAGSVLLGNNDV